MWTFALQWYYYQELVSHEHTINIIKLYNSERRRRIERRHHRWHACQTIKQFDGRKLTFLGSSVRTGRAVTIGAVLVAVWVLKLILLTVVLAARAALAQLDDLHMLDGGVVAVLAAKLAAGAAGLSAS